MRSVVRWFIALVGFVRKELLGLLGQPRLLIVLVLGPFAILLLFGAGYKNETISLRTVFVVAGEQDIEEQIEANEENLRDYVVPVLFTPDLILARTMLSNGEIDLVVVVPPDASETVRSGEQVEIAVLHDKLDPIQRAAVDIAAEVAVQEINAGVVTEIVRFGQQELESNASEIDALLELSQMLSERVEQGRDDDVAEAAANLDQRLETTSLAAGMTLRLLEGVGGDGAVDEERAAIAQLQDDIAEVSALLDDLQDPFGPGDTEADVATINRDIEDLTAALAEIETLPAEVVVRPFRQDTKSIVGRFIGPVDFFAPSALALLIQHAGLTFAALTMVRDRDIGVTEHYRVSSTPSSAVLLGKGLAFVTIGGILAAILVVVVDVGLGVQSDGSVAHLALIFGLLLASSIAIGLCLSLLARTDSQAVQYAMLVLLASLFFGGFFLDLDALRYPFKALAWLLPVTYSIRGLQDVMLRGAEVAVVDIVGLVVITIVAGTGSWLLLRRETRPN